MDQKNIMEISAPNQRNQTDKFSKTSHKVAVAGHICLDIIPSFGSERRDFENFLIQFVGFAY